MILKFTCSGSVKLVEDVNRYSMILAISQLKEVQPESDVVDIATIAKLIYLLSRCKCRLQLKDYRNNYKILELDPKKAHIDHIQYYRGTECDIVIDVTEDPYEKHLDQLGGTWFYFIEGEVTPLENCNHSQITSLLCSKLV